MRRSLNDTAGGRAEAVAPGKPSIAEAIGHFERFLAERALKLTAARRAIVEAVLERAGHFPIEELIGDLRRRGIRGSKATVYRTLPLLTEAGIVQQAVMTGETRSYEAVGREHHDHLVCLGCGKVVEFEFEAFEILQREIAARHGFRLEGHHHQLVGRCADCQRTAAGPDGSSSAGSGSSAGSAAGPGRGNAH